MRVAWLNFAGSVRLSNTCANGMPHYGLFLGQDTPNVLRTNFPVCTCIEATGRGITTTHRGWLGLCSCSPLQWERRQPGSRSKRQPHTTLVRCVYYQQTRPAAVQLQGRVYLGATTLTIRLGHSRCRMVLLGCTRVAVQAHPVLPRDWKPPANENRWRLSVRTRNRVGVCDQGDRFGTRPNNEGLVAHMHGRSHALPLTCYGRWLVL